MRAIYVRNVTKILHGDTILESVNLTVPGGTFFALLGPSGSGKTTLLRLIAGFETPNSGSIWLGDTDITHQPINKRSINTVFQHYALFPHMNVFDNIAYSLRVMNMSSDVIEHKVMKIVQTVHLEKQVYKAIDQLSGGQQQRVALARAVINEPEVLLLDEPLAALDLKLRERMLIELIELQITLGTTFLYVTHDQMEALTVADKMAIMNFDGHIEQIGTPKEVYEFPTSAFVAQFVGTTNLLKGVLHKEHDRHYFRVDDLGLFEVAIAKDKSWRSDIQLYMSIRPEKIEITKNPVEGFSNKLLGTVASIVYHGRSTQYNVRLKNGLIVHVFEQNEEHFPREVIDYDDTVYLYWQKENVILLDR
jgi:spermidine/putrescine transport system ATP-binding protein